MSDLMFYGVLRMPYEMAMSDELSRRQFWSRAQEAADRVEVAEAELARRAAQPADVGAGELKLHDFREDEEFAEMLDDVHVALKDWKPGGTTQPYVAAMQKMNRYLRDRISDAIAADRRARGEHGCKWPTCETERVQQEIADQAYRELYSGEESPQAAQGVSAADAVSLMLWLYRRLPRTYGRPPHVEAPIAALAKVAGIDVADSFSERDPAPPLSSEQQAEKGADACGS